MPISHKHKVIFVHIPKTGGGSIEQALGVWGSSNRGGTKKDSDILYGYGTDPNAALQHLTASEINALVPAAVYEAYFKFSVVRNPFDRLVSEYWWQKKEGMKLFFKEFLLKEVLPKKEEQKHYMDQYKFITDENGNVIVDFVARFETLSDDIKYIFHRVGINKRLKYVHRVKSLNWGRYSDYYDKETLDLVAKLYSKDIEFFSYKAESNVTRGH